MSEAPEAPVPESEEPAPPDPVDASPAPQAPWTLWCAVASGVFLALACLAHLLEPQLLAYWDGHYGNWRDDELAMRVRGLAPWLLTAALMSSVAAGVMKVAGPRPLGLGPWKRLLGATIVVGSIFSWLEWRYWGFNCLDGYCDRATLWANWIRSPSAEAFELLRVAIVESPHGTSALPPFLVGLVAAPGVKIWVAFMLVNAAAWMAIALGVGRIARRHLGASEKQVLFALLLVFGHFSTMRSLFHLQTDPIPVAFAVWAVVFNLDLLERPRSIPLWAGLLLVVLGGLISKLTFFPMLCLPGIFPLLSGGELRERVRRALVGCGNVALQLVAFGLFLWVTGLWAMLYWELWGVGDYREKSGDDELHRLITAFVTNVQFVPFLLFAAWRRQEISRKGWLLVGVAALFPASLVGIGGIYWVRYLLGMIPFMAAVCAAPLLRRIGDGLHGWLLIAAGVGINAAYLGWGLYL